MPDVTIGNTGAYDGNSADAAKIQNHLGTEHATANSGALTLKNRVQFDNSGSSLIIRTGLDTEFNGSDVYAPAADYLTSGGTIPSGTTVGASNNKDMSFHNISMGQVYSPFTSNLTLNGAYKWTDWGSDIFDNWGNFWICPNTNISQCVSLSFGSNQNGPDGTMYTNTQSVTGLGTINMRHGYVAQGIFRLEVTSTSSTPFRVGMFGNMGSDNSTLHYPYLSTNTTWGNLRYLKNQQQGSSSEIFYLYHVPKNKTDNDAGIQYTAGKSGNDYIFLYSNALTSGHTFYFAKTNDVMNWVKADIGLRGNLIGT